MGYNMLETALLLSQLLLAEACHTGRPGVELYSSSFSYPYHATTPVLFKVAIVTSEISVVHCVTSCAHVLSSTHCTQQFFDY